MLVAVTICAIEKTMLRVLVPKGGIDSARPFNLFSTKEFSATG